MTAAVHRGAQLVASLSFDDGPVTIGRAQAILKRTLNAGDVKIPRRAARLDVDRHRDVDPDQPAREDSARVRSARRWQTRLPARARRDGHPVRRNEFNGGESQVSEEWVLRMRTQAY